MGFSLQLCDANQRVIGEPVVDALKQLDKALGEGGVADALATWTIIGVTGQRGGIDWLHTVKETITATRSPEWGMK